MSSESTTSGISIGSGGKKGKPRPCIVMSQYVTGEIVLCPLLTLGNKSIHDPDFFPHVTKKELYRLWVPVHLLPHVIPLPLYNSIVIEPSLSNPSYISLLTKIETSQHLIKSESRCNIKEEDFGRLEQLVAITNIQDYGRNR